MKKKISWTVISLGIAVFSIYAVVSQNHSFSFVQLFDRINLVSLPWIMGAVIFMFGFIFFEGAAICVVLKRLGSRKGTWKCVEYSAADIYFSAITPSASGGQLASAALMIKDGASAAVTTASLIANLIMYTMALIATGIMAIILKPDVLSEFGSFSLVLIIGGYTVMALFGMFFLLLLFRARLMYSICDFFLRVLKRLRLIKNVKKKQLKLKKIVQDYAQCSNIMIEHKELLLYVFIFNLLQRMSQICISVMIYMAMGGEIGYIKDVFVTQIMVAIGSNCVPVPGAMGVADYLILDGFAKIPGITNVVEFELFSRGISFYICIIMSAVIFGVALLRRKIKTKR